MKALMAHIVAAFLGILVLAQAQYAWRPQGRFGKRTMGEENAAILPSTGVGEDNEYQYPWFKSRLEPVTTAAFRAPGIVCINDGVEGRYLCYRQRTSSDAASDEH